MPAAPSEIMERCHSVRRVSAPQRLDAIHQDEVDAVIWTRNVPRSVSSFLSSIPVCAMSEEKAHLPISGVADWVRALVQTWSSHAEGTAQWLSDDIETLAHHFARQLDLSDILLRVEWVRDDACRKFHRDMVQARLICTYHGPGTEFGLAEDAGTPRHVETVPTGNAIMLKGKKWPTTPMQPLLHRSPPIEGTGASRLIVVINEIPPSTRQRLSGQIQS